MEIGGFFPYQPVGSEPNNYVEHTCPDPGDTAHLMSGRCAIYYCLRDLMLTDQKRVAYLPSWRFCNSGYYPYSIFSIAGLSGC